MVNSNKKTSHVTLCPLQLTNQSRMEGGQDASGQSSSLLPLSGFPMQVRPPGGSVVFVVR